jgi:lipoprotein-anchoring transpeptidase ErfK/SrfK
MIVDDGNSAGEARAARPGRFSRRSFLFGATVGLGAVALAGCSGGVMSLAQAEKHYGPKPDERFPIPGVNLNKVSAKYYRQTVRYASKEAPGTIIVDPRNHYVYRIEGDGTATRYGVSVGRAGFLWSGEAYVGRKSEWPIWTPPKEMIERQPEAAKYAGGMKPGLDNPLGARALHLYENGVYPLYTLYSTIRPETIGKGISSGCVGLLTQDMLELYERTPVNTKVVVLKA